MFKSSSAKRAVEDLDFTQLLRDTSEYAFASLADLGLGAELSALAFDPVQSLLAVGTSNGQLVVCGGPQVQLSWDLGRPLKVKHLAFRPGSGFLAAVDSKDTLSVYDLSRLDRLGKPTRDSSLSMRSAITCLEASASVPFLFLGGKDGTVDVFDIDRGVLAPHARVPNLWLAQEEILRRSGVQDAPSRRHIPVCLDIKVHPVDVNLLLVAYEGGVSLWNIAQQCAERNWDFVVPPGAPGGGNDPEDLIFAERRPGVTCLAWRPDGLLFAVGHEDGCISFASAVDENPITMRTLERSDVNKATEEDLFGWSAQGEPGQRKPANREPIFRLAWSAFPGETLYDKAVASWSGASAGSPTPASPPPSGSATGFESRAIRPPEERTHLDGGTVLTVLGGLLPHDPTGVHLLELPAYVPPTGSSTSKHTGNIPAPLRQALKESVQPLQHNLYPTSSPPEDFLLLPRSSPHHGMAFDPNAIIITTGSDRSLPVLAAAHSPRGLEAWSFPPTNTRPVRRFDLPPILSFSGSSTCTSAKLYNVPTLSYHKLLHQSTSPAVPFNTNERLPLKGGISTPKPRPNQPNNPTRKSASHPRVLVTLHLDLTVRFWDVSDSLLHNVEEDVPRPLSHLDVNLRSLLKDPVAMELDVSRVFRERPWEVELDKVDLATETLELAVSFSSGEVVVLRLVYGEQESSAWRAEDAFDRTAEDAHETVTSALNDLSLDTVPEQPPDLASGHNEHLPHSTNASSKSDERQTSTSPRRRMSLRKPSSIVSHSEPALEIQDQCIDLSLATSFDSSIDSFRPVCALRLPPPPSVSASSARKASCVVISNIGFVSVSSGAALMIVDLRGPEVLLYEDPATVSIHGKGKGKGSDASPVTSLSWAICALGQDLERSPRLVVNQGSGSCRVFELSQIVGDSSWLLAGKVPSFQHDTAAGAFATFILDKLGAEAGATPTNLQLALGQQANLSAADLDAKGALTSLWITVSPSAVAAYFNIDGPRTAVFESSGLVSAALAVRFGCPVLAVVSKSRQITVLSLPDLSQITRMSFSAAVHTDVGEISISRDGDLVQNIDPFTIKLHTIFDIGKNTLAGDVALHRPEIPVPAQLSVVTSAKSAFSSLFGGQKVFGPAEVEAILGGPNRPPPKAREPLAVRSALPQHASQSNPAKPTPRVQQVQGDMTSTSNILAQTTEALRERGEYLGTLQERLGGMASEAAKFAQDTHKMAKQEAAKATLKTIRPPVDWRTLSTRVADLKL
ncbi:hypothetical protein T439DRAFT_377696 [Meredithblackwellia eburnea MCA 4105]